MRRLHQATCFRAWALLILFLGVCASTFTATAERWRTDSLSVTVFFKVNRTELLPDYMDNERSLRRLAEVMRARDSIGSRIRIVGYASPEGGYRNNERLARDRAASISRFMQMSYSIAADQIEEIPIGVDWPGLVDTLLVHPEIPDSRAALNIISTTADYAPDGRWTGERTAALQKLDEGRLWSYLLTNVNPRLRGADVHILYNVSVPSPHVDLLPPAVLLPEPSLLAYEPLHVEPQTEAHTGKSIYWSLHTNLLYDVAIIPNIGAELYLGRNVSLMANYWNAWWDSDNSHRFWRTYGMGVAARYWFGRNAHAKPLTGHHLGLYGQALLYDFEFGGTGYLSGTPGRNIFHHPTLSAGVEYGYAHPISPRLNLDFAIVLGFLGGRNQEYVPDSGSYRWKATHNLRWFGPIKAEISLVWLLGRDNFNRKKGGAR